MITLSSDFGRPYPAAMRGVILQETDARLVDIAHDFPRQNVRTTAFWLTQILPYFPPAVHLVVVDPGVGTERDAIVIRAGEHALVGPDNGVLLPAARLLGSGEVEAFKIAYKESELAGNSASGVPNWPPAAESSTFHGRDVFAPAAARVHEASVADFPSKVGFESAEEIVGLSLPEPTIEADGVLGEALAVDGFGNVITNIPGETLSGRFGDNVNINGVWATVRRAYAEVEEGHRVVTVGSHGNVELAVNQGRGDETFGVYSGGRVRLTW